MFCNGWVSPVLKRVQSNLKNPCSFFASTKVKLSCPPHNRGFEFAMPQQLRWLNVFRRSMLVVDGQYVVAQVDEAFTCFLALFDGPQEDVSSIVNTRLFILRRVVVGAPEVMAFVTHRSGSTLSLVTRGRKVEQVSETL